MGSKEFLQVAKGYYLSTVISTEGVVTITIEKKIEKLGLQNTISY